MEYNKIYVEDNIQTLKRMPDNYLKLTITSPPYDNLRSYQGVKNIKKLSKLLYSKTSPGGVVVWIVADQTKNYSESCSSFKQAIQFVESGWCLYDTMIWEKTNYMPTNHMRYSDAFEYMFVFSKGKPSTFNPLKIKCKTAGKSQKWSERPHESKIWKKNGNQTRSTLPEKVRPNIWKQSIGRGGSTNDAAAFEHPAIFPEQIVADHIYSWSNPGDIVYDCYGGSGTTPKMAHILGRKWIMSEIEPDFARIAERRLKPYLTQKQLFNLHS